MSVSAQEPLRHTAPTPEFSELSQDGEIQGGLFQKLMRVQPIGEKSDDRSFFSLFETEDEEVSAEEPDNAAVCHVLPPHQPLPAPVEKKKEKGQSCHISPCTAPPLLLPDTPATEEKDPSCQISCAAPIPLLLDTPAAEEEDPSCQISCAAPIPLLPGTPAPITESPRGPAPSPVIEAAFETMASTMLIMDASGEIETTFFLDNPQFASSVLFGTKVTIREFSTAPKMFNIEIASNPHGVAVMDAGRSSLLAAFENAHLNFTVHRFDTHLQQSEKGPVFHRKENHDQNPQDQKGGRRQ